MNIENLFEIAARKKFRFESKVGLLSVEDLWGLPLTSATKASLDGVAVQLSQQLKGSEESFVSTSKKNTELEQKLELVKYIIKVRMEEAAAVIDAEKRKEQRSKIAAIIEKKESESLESLSLDELKELAKNL